MADFPGKLFTGTSFTPSYRWLLNPDTAEIKTVEVIHTIDDGDAPDDGVVKSGLVLGIITASGKFVQYSDGAGDGSQTAKAILLHPIKKVDVFGAAIAAPVFAAVVLRARVDGTLLTGIDANGRTDLRAQGFLFDDELP